MERCSAKSRDLPQGLTCEVTGSAAIGREYSLRSQAALKRTSWVTVLAVLVILVIVYRSPLGAIVRGMIETLKPSAWAFPSQRPV